MEVIKYVDREVIKEVPVEKIREVEVIREVKVEVPKEVRVEVIREVSGTLCCSVGALCCSMAPDCPRAHQPLLIDGARLSEGPSAFACPSSIHYSIGGILFTTL